VLPTVTAWYGIKAAGLFAATMALVVARRGRHPFPRFGPANVTTTVRALLTALIAGFIGEAASPANATFAVGLGVVAAALDRLDGWLARRTKMASAFGARYDMEVDALLIQVLAILVWQHQKAGAWILASGLLRYVFVAAGWVWDWMRSPLFPSVRRKAICAIQTMALLVSLWPPVTLQASVVVAAAGLGVLFYSFLTDTIWLWTHRSVASGVEG
jgi:phosphatidylglycerophosphate synthase